MGRKTVLDVCKVCGGLGRKINYVSKSKGKVYHYSKFVHPNGITHYYRLRGEPASQNNLVNEQRTSVFDSLENIIEIKMHGRELTFGEIKSKLDESTNRPVSVATIYRNINKMLKLDLITKRIDRNTVLYRGKDEEQSSANSKSTRMSMGFDFTVPETEVTLFVRVKNLGLRLINGFPISLPVGVIDSFDKIDLIAFDETKKIPLTKENIAYSYADQTGVSITLNRPIRKTEEVTFFLTYTHKFEERPINIFIPSDLDTLKVNCEVEKGREVVIKKRLGDGLKQIEPPLVRKTGTESGHTIFEAEFDDVSRGDTLVVSFLSK